LNNPHLPAACPFIDLQALLQSNSPLPLLKAHNEASDVLFILQEALDLPVAVQASLYDVLHSACNKKKENESKQIKEYSICSYKLIFIAEKNKTYLYITI
jgi:hypothetical protein